MIFTFFENFQNPSCPAGLYHPDPDDVIDLHAEDPSHRNEVVNGRHIPSGLPLGHGNGRYPDPVRHLRHGHPMRLAHSGNVPAGSDHINAWHG